MPLSSDRHIIDEQFSRQLRNHKAQPSGKVWSRISYELNNSHEGNSRTGRIILLVLLALFLGSGTALVISHKKPSERSSNKEIKQVSQSETTSLTGKEINNHPYARTQIVSPIAFNDVQAQSASCNVTSNHQKAKHDVPVCDLKESMESESSLTLSVAPKCDMVFLPADQVQLSSPTYTAKRNVKSSRSSLTKFKYNPKFYIADVKGFYIGLGQTINSTWVLDSKAIASDNLKYHPTFGLAVMIHGGYNLNNKWGIEGAWIINSHQGQKYEYLPVYTRTTSLEYTEKHISFDYMQVPVMMRLKVQGWSGFTQTPIFANYSLGLQYGRMLSYSIDEQKKDIEETELYRKNEIAIVAGLDYDFISRSPMYFSIGVRTSYGSNLFTKEISPDLEFQRPHNFLVGLHAAINFSIPSTPKLPE